MHDWTIARRPRPPTRNASVCAPTHRVGQRDTSRLPRVTRCTTPATVDRRPSALVHARCTTRSPSVASIGQLNARSVCNKSAATNDLIIEHLSSTCSPSSSRGMTLTVRVLSPPHRRATVLSRRLDLAPDHFPRTTMDVFVYSCGLISSCAPSHCQPMTLLRFFCLPFAMVLAMPQC